MVKIMPDTVKFLMFFAAIAALIYGAAFSLSSFPPQQFEVSKSLAHEKLKQSEIGQ